MSIPIPPIVGDSTVIDAGFWLRAAHGSVRRFCGWHVAPVVRQILTLDGSGGSDILLPSLRIVELAGVRNDGVDVTSSVDTSKAGILRLRSGRWTDRLGGVTVELEHGHALEEVPEVAALIATLAKRGATGATQQYASQSVNGASVSAFAQGGAPLSVPLLQSEKALLAPYRLDWGT